MERRRERKQFCGICTKNGCHAMWSFAWKLHSAKSTTVLLSTAMVLPVPVPHSARATTAVLSSTVVDFALCTSGYPIDQKHILSSLHAISQPIVKQQTNTQQHTQI